MEKESLEKCDPPAVSLDCESNSEESPPSYNNSTQSKKSTLRYWLVALVLCVLIGVSIYFCYSAFETKSHLHKCASQSKKVSKELLAAKKKIAEFLKKPKPSSAPETGPKLPSEYNGFGETNGDGDAPDSYDGNQYGGEGYFGGFWSGFFSNFLPSGSYSEYSSENKDPDEVWSEVARDLSSCIRDDGAAYLEVDCTKKTLKSHSWDLTYVLPNHGYEYATYPSSYIEPEYDPAAELPYVPQYGIAYSAHNKK